MQAAMGPQSFERFDCARRSVSQLPDLLRSPGAFQNATRPLLLVRRVPFEIGALREAGSEKFSEFIEGPAIES
jgi:hypothetical protein